MEIKIFNNLQEVKNEWEQLVPKSQTATFFQTFDWAQIWFEHFLLGQPYILTFREKDLLALAPFLRNDDKFSLWGTAKVLNGELVTDYGDIVSQKGQEEKIWMAILDHFKSLGEGKKLELSFLKGDSPSLAFLKSQSQAEIIDMAPFLDLSANWDDYLLSLARKKRHELKRKIRRLEAAGAFKICLMENLEQELPDFFRLVKISNDQKRDFLRPEMESFFRDIIHRFNSKGMVDLCFLDFEGQKVATTLSFNYNNETLLYNSGFDPQFSHLAPGFLLKAFLIKRAIKEGKRRFDFLRGDERYKYDLGAKDQKLYEVVIGGKK